MREKPIYSYNDNPSLPVFKDLPDRVYGPLDMRPIFPSEIIIDMGEGHGKDRFQTIRVNTEPADPDHITE